MSLLPGEHTEVSEHAILDHFEGMIWGRGGWGARGVCVGGGVINLFFCWQFFMEVEDMLVSHFLCELLHFPV